MSANKTQNFELHVWESGDSFLRSEFNENFVALDGAVQIVTGAYVGDGSAERSFELGFRPRAVMATDNSGIFRNSAAVYGGIALDGKDIAAVAITDSGFSVFTPGGYSVVKPNMEGSEYRYLALR